MSRKKGKPTPAPAPAPAPSPTPTPVPAPTPAPASAAASGLRFAPSSFWYQPIPASAPLNPSSAAYVRDLLNQVSAASPGLSVTKWCAAVYQVSADAPLHKVAIDPAGYQDPDLAAMWAKVPLPDYVAAPLDSDASVLIHQPSTDTIWEFWRFARTATGPQARWGGRMTGVSANPGIWDKPWGTCATGIASLQITPEELAAGRIEHAMGVTLFNPAQTFSWPANRNSDSVSGIVPEGIRFRLDPALNIDALGLHPLAATIARAAQTYGFVAWDRGGSVALRCVSSLSYTQQGKADPYPALLGGASQYAVLDQFPWDRMQFMPMDYGKPS